MGTVLIAPVSASASVAADPSEPWDLVYDANYKEYKSRSTSLHCNDTTSDTLNLVVDVTGGPAHVIACLQDEKDTWLTCEQYDRP